MNISRRGQIAIGLDDVAAQRDGKVRGTIVDVVVMRPKALSHFAQALQDSMKTWPATLPRYRYFAASSPAMVQLPWYCSIMIPTVTLYGVKAKSSSLLSSASSSATTVIVLSRISKNTVYRRLNWYVSGLQPVLSPSAASICMLRLFVPALPPLSHHHRRHAPQGGVNTASSAALQAC
ncbi:hypothetical protein EXIGLDRAFT_241657 [Exidia glandulosa HHB12029]|uniref:Uncharacterized protein n=1 Tax=Exidia glandulosa HHB12029 TaxID=1314781 RepID=A0A165Q745_EXIGL|nr:hypothetical protein EXIGLDRAFT_241657 [Exidia glandulosa HHB12029]